MRAPETRRHVDRSRRAVAHLLRLIRSTPVRQDALAEWRRRLLGEPTLPAGTLRRALVLCDGNICQSPFAAQLLAAAGPSLEIRSAGLAAAEGHPADASARRVAHRFGVALEGHRSHRVTGEDLDGADLVLVMQGAQASAVRALSPGASDRTRILGDFLPTPPHLLPDPWGRDEDFFVETFSRVARAVERLGVLLDGGSQGRSGPRGRE